MTLDAENAVGERLWAIFKTLLFTVLVPGAVTVLIPYYLLPAGTRAEFSGWRFLGPPLIVLGAAGYFWCAWNFAWRGLGTPAPIDPPRILVARGPYRFVRNPMYVSVLTVVVGEAVLFASLSILIAAAIGWLFFHTFVVLYEEPTLRSKFGSSYEGYCRQVPRWVPKLRK
jgi:protein-S-isoprenylcysteine O-methyltransferase Ste14